MPYTYDVFISYKSGSLAGEWVRKYFYPELLKYLEAELPNAPNLFLDSEKIRAGMHWEPALGRAIREAKCLIAILSAPYFTSDYCLMEWHSFRDREAKLGMGTPQNPAGLIIPIRFADGAHFDASARRPQAIDMGAFAYTGDAFRESQQFLLFQQRIAKLASDLADGQSGQVAKPPDYEPWPVRPAKPEPPEPELGALPRVQ